MRRKFNWDKIRSVVVDLSSPKILLPDRGPDSIDEIEYDRSNGSITYSFIWSEYGDSPFSGMLKITFDEDDISKCAIGTKRDFYSVFC